MPYFNVMDQQDFLCIDNKRFYQKNNDYLLYQMMIVCGMEKIFKREAISMHGQLISFDPITGQSVIGHHQLRTVDVAGRFLVVMWKRIQ